MTHIIDWQPFQYAEIPTEGLELPSGRFVVVRRAYPTEILAVAMPNEKQVFADLLGSHDTTMKGISIPIGPDFIAAASLVCVMCFVAPRLWARDAWARPFVPLAEVPTNDRLRVMEWYTGCQIRW